MTNQAKENAQHSAEIHSIQAAAQRSSQISSNLLSATKTLLNESNDKLINSIASKLTLTSDLEQSQAQVTELQKLLNTEQAKVEHANNRVTQFGDRIAAVMWFAEALMEEDPEFQGAPKIDNKVLENIMTQHKDFLKDEKFQANILSVMRAKAAKENSLNEEEPLAEVVEAPEDVEAHVEVEAPVVDTGKSLASSNVHNTGAKKARKLDLAEKQA